MEKVSLAGRYSELSFVEFPKLSHSDCESRTHKTCLVKVQRPLRGQVSECFCHERSEG